MAGRVSARLLSGALGVLLIAQPVAAQTGADLLRQGVCGTKAASMIAAVWGGGVVFLGAYGLYRAASGMWKLGNSDPSEVTEGRERIKGAGWAFGASLFLLGGERVLAFLGIPILECINVGFL